MGHMDFFGLLSISVGELRDVGLEYFPLFGSLRYP